MIYAEFLLIKSTNQEDDELLGRAEIEEGPMPNEVFNIGGHPYIVVERQWSLDLESVPGENLFCFYRLTPYNVLGTKTLPKNYS